MHKRLWLKWLLRRRTIPVIIWRGSLLLSKMQARALRLNQRDYIHTPAREASKMGIVMAQLMLCVRTY